VGYDIEFVAFKPAAGTDFPMEAGPASKLVEQSGVDLDADAVKRALLDVEGCKAGPEGSIDYLGSGLSYARLTLKSGSIHVENNCGAKDLLKLHSALEQRLGPVFILDLQSGRLHDAQSFSRWWARPL